MKRFICLILIGILLLNVSPIYSEDKKKTTEGERYKLYIVENLDTLKSANHLPMGIVGDKNNYILIDSFSGKTWILVNITTPITEIDGNQKYLDGFAWEPIFFRKESNVWKNYKGIELSVNPN